MMKKKMVKVTIKTQARKKHAVISIALPFPVTSSLIEIKHVFFYFIEWYEVLFVLTGNILALFFIFNTKELLSHDKTSISTLISL